MTETEAAALRDTLLKRLRSRTPELQRLEEYRDGHHPLPTGLTQSLGTNRAAQLQQLHRRLMVEACSNWVGLVVDAPLERLRVNGFRFTGDLMASEAAEGIWQRNKFDAQSLLIHDASLTTGTSYVMVWPNTDGLAVMSAEHPCEVIVAYSPNGERVAALKYWVDATRTAFATLYLADELWKWQSASTVEKVNADSITWEPRKVPGEMRPLVNVMGVVPIVELRANPRLRPAPYGGGCSEMAGVLSIQDRINETTFGRLIATHYQAFRQRWATGLEIPTDEDGNPIEPFEAAVDRLWVAEDDRVKFGDFADTSLVPYLSAVEADVQHLAAISHTPPQYLLGQVVNISGDALKAAESGLIAKVRRHQLFFGEAWEEVLRLAFRAEGNVELADDTAAEVIWADPETTTESTRVDALTKMATLGVPNEVLWERWGATPQEIARWKALAAADELASATNVPASPPAVGMTMTNGQAAVTLPAVPPTR